MIEVQGLTKRYGKTVAVNALSFSVKKGEILGFLGPNGAGKTTTMRVLTGYLPPTTGTVRVAGYDVVQSPLEVKNRVGYLPETPPLYTDMRVHEMLDFAARIKGVPARQIKTRREYVAEKTAVTNVLNKIVGHLSKGYRQRVGLAAALINDPELLVLDEPTAGLDPKQIIETRKLIQSLSRDHTIILSTHILPEAANTCNRVMIISAGQLVAEDTPENLMHRMQGFATLRLVVEGPQEPVREALAGLEGVHEVSPIPLSDGRVEFSVQMAPEQDRRKELARKVVEGGWGLLELRPTGMSLEEIFLKLTTKDTAPEAEQGASVAAPPVEPATEPTQKETES